MSEFDRINTVLSDGGVALLPTETVYGLACQADHKLAVDKVYTIKGRDFDKPLAVCVRDIAQAETLGVLTKTARNLTEQYWPGSLTIIVQAKSGIGIDPRCLSKIDNMTTIALRCPDAAWRDQITAPLALTSANRSDEPDCVNYEAAMLELGAEIDISLTSDRSLSGAPSTIVTIENEAIRILRQGDLILSESQT